MWVWVRGCGQEWDRVHEWDCVCMSRIACVCGACVRVIRYYLTNFHKHYSSSKSSAALYVRADRQQLYVPAPSVIDKYVVGLESGVCGLGKFFCVSLRLCVRGAWV